MHFILKCSEMRTSVLFSLDCLFLRLGACRAATAQGLTPVVSPLRYSSRKPAPFPPTGRKPSDSCANLHACQTCLTGLFTFKSLSAPETLEALLALLFVTINIVKDELLITRRSYSDCWDFQSHIFQIAFTPCWSLGTWRTCERWGHFNCLTRCVSPHILIEAPVSVGKPSAERCVCVCVALRHEAQGFQIDQ